jgi:hypothetical protein
VPRENRIYKTPEQYKDAVRAVLGRSIDHDFDPFKEIDLESEWGGTVFLHLRAGLRRGTPSRAVEKLVESVEAGVTTKAIVLVNNHCQSARWFKPLWDYTLCFKKGRIKFDCIRDGVTSQTKTSPTFGSVFVHLSKKRDCDCSARREFASVFEVFGGVVSAYNNEGEMA